MSVEIVVVPDVLGAAKRSVETLYEVVVAAPQADTYLFDMHNVRFVRPYGIVALVCSSRLLASRSGQPVRVARTRTDVHQYLERMDVFAVGERWLEPTTILREKWSRNEASDRLLEVTPIRCQDDVLAIADRARRIFGRWLGAADQHRLVNVLSELCGNIYQHSGDSDACAAIQTHRSGTSDTRTVRLSVGDLGCGIRGTLRTVYPELGEQPIDFVEAALQGYTSRGRNDRGGLGLRSVEEIATTGGGHLWLRSETAAVLRHQKYAVRRHDLAYVHGTQLAVDLRSCQGT